MTVVIENNKENRRTREQLLQDFAEGQFLTQEIFAGLIDSVVLLDDISGSTDGQDMIVQLEIERLKQRVSAIETTLADINNQIASLTQQDIEQITTPE